MGTQDSAKPEALPYLITTSQNPIMSGRVLGKINVRTYTMTKRVKMRIRSLETCYYNTHVNTMQKQQRQMPRLLNFMRSL